MKRPYSGEQHGRQTQKHAGCHGVSISGQIAASAYFTCARATTSAAKAVKPTATVSSPAFPDAFERRGNTVDGHSSARHQNLKLTIRN
jgi:hypothetical protein